MPGPAFAGSVQNHSTSGPLTLNYNTGGGGTTAGNCLVACITAWATPVSGGAVVSGITLGGSADNWAYVTGASESQIWIDPDCAGGQTAIQVSASGGTDFMLNVFVMEFSDVAQVSPVDRSAGAGGTFGSFSSGTTAGTRFAAEAWAGIGAGDSTSPFTIAGPGLPWANLGAISNSSGTEFTRSVAGYQITTATGNAGYSGSFSPPASQNGSAAAVALKPASVPGRPPLIIPSPQAVRRAANW
jgi:hypothetical protein